MYIVDTANTEQIKRSIEFFPVDGVTTNPTIISKEKKNFPELIKEISSIIGKEKMFHIQVTGTNSDDIIKEAMALRDYIGGNLYIKIPISPEGLKATSELKRRGIKVTETAIFTQQQALIAAKAGADFVAPYVNRLDNIVSDGVNVVGEIVEMFENYNLDCRVLAASFKTVEQIHKIAMVGAHAVTLNPELLDSLTYHPLTLYAIDDFMADWEVMYGKEKILEMLEKVEIKK
jgi:Transaldolase